MCLAFSSQRIIEHDTIKANKQRSTEVFFTVESAIVNWYGIG
jgi:hypothetical protein